MHRWRVAIPMLLLLGSVACQTDPAPPPPSILLFVLDTTRADAVSAYGAIQDTTPAIDSLAAKGILYTRAYSHAPWTLPSHTSLFTGLLPSQHGVGWHRGRAPNELVTLAERLRDVGYETFGVSENGVVGDMTNLTQGFEKFVLAGKGERESVEHAVSEWIKTREADRPFFLFVNVVDPHAEYVVHDTNRFLPAGVSDQEALSIDQLPQVYMCAEEPKARELSILHGLYHGEMPTADAKVARVFQLLGGTESPSDLITIIAADHGEHFGEHGLVSHQFSVREALLHVPLIVHGLPGESPAVVDDLVQLADIVPSVLSWSGLAIPPDLPGRPLPTRSGESDRSRLIVSQSFDPKGNPRRRDMKALRSRAEVIRSRCGSQWPVHGNMGALLGSRYKLIWFEQFPPELYDLSVDPEERKNLAAERPDLTADLLAKYHTAISGNATASSRVLDESEVPKEILENLKALGYLSDTTRSTEE